MQVYLQKSAKCERAHDRATASRDGAGCEAPPAKEQLRSHANAPTTERPEGAKVQNGVQTVVLREVCRILSVFVTIIGNNLQ